MEYILGIIAALIGGLFFYKKKADKVAIDAKLSESKGRDRELREQELDLKDAIAEIDANLEKIRKEREAKNNRTKTLKEIRDELKKKRGQ